MKRKDLITEVYELIRFAWKAKEELERGGACTTAANVRMWLEKMGAPHEA